MVLGIETSTLVCSVGFADASGARVHLSVTEPHIHSEKLLTLLGRLMADSGKTLTHIDAVAVSIGPGSFTGLRIGLSAAKGLCYALSRPIVAVPTFHAIAHAALQAAPGEGNIVVALDAKKGDYYAGVFQKRGGIVVEIRETTVVTRQELETRLQSDGPAFLVSDGGEMVEAVRARGGRAQGVGEFCRGDIVAELGVQRVAAKEFADVASLEPMYLKDFVVQTSIPAAS